MQGCRALCRHLHDEAHERSHGLLIITLAAFLTATRDSSLTAHGRGAVVIEKPSQIFEDGPASRRRGLVNTVARFAPLSSQSAVPTRGSSVLADGRQTGVSHWETPLDTGATAISCFLQLRSLLSLGTLLSNDANRSATIYISLKRIGTGNLELLRELLPMVGSGNSLTWWKSQRRAETQRTLSANCLSQTPPTIGLGAKPCNTNAEPTMQS